MKGNDMQEVLYLTISNANLILILAYQKSKVSKVKVDQSYATLCNHMDCSPLDSFVHGISQARIQLQFSCSVQFDSLQPHGLQQASNPAHHQLPEPAQTHVHRVGDAIQPSHTLSSPPPPAFNLPQHLFQ